jgi:hypothetical protein
LVFQLAQVANLLHKPIEVFRNHFDDNLAAQFSVRLLFRIRSRDVATLFVCECGDLLNCEVKTENFQFNLRISDEFAIS